MRQSLEGNDAQVVQQVVPKPDVIAHVKLGHVAGERDHIRVANLLAEIGADDPDFVAGGLGEREGLRREDLPEALAREKTRYARRQARAAEAPEVLRTRITDPVDKVPVGKLPRPRPALDLCVDPLRQGEPRQPLPGRRDQVVVSRHGAEFALEERFEVAVEPLANRGIGGGEARAPVGPDPSQDQLAVEALRCHQHEVDLERVIKEHFAIQSAPDLLLQPPDHARQQCRVQDPAIGMTRPRAELAALVKAGAQKRGGDLFTFRVAAGNLPKRVERRENLQNVRALLVECLPLLLISGRFLADQGDVVLIDHIARVPRPGEAQ